MNLKLNIHLLYVLVISMLFCSCEKYLDIRRTSTESPIQTSNDLQLLLDNTSLNSGLPSDMNLSSDDFYVTEDGYNSEFVSPEDRNFYTWSPTAIRGTGESQWQQAYKIIYYTNLILEYADKFKKEGNGDIALLNKQRGAALFIRAYCHWWIAQLYARPYISTTASQSLGIPLRLNSDINEKSVRGTLEETYSKILADLQEAVSLLPESTTISSRPSKVAAYAMLSRVYLSMENYPLALTNADASLKLNSNLLDFNTLDQESESPFIKYNKEVIYNSVTAGSSLLEPGFESPIAEVDSLLVNSYEPDDLRGILYIKRNAEPFDATYRFTGNYTGASSSALFNGLAVDEIYLNRAEAFARAGNAVSAMQDLNTLLRTRWKTGSYIDIVGLGSDEVLARIILERRKELLFRGLRWTDLRRLNRDNRFAKNLIRNIEGSIYTLPPNDNRYTLLIPQDVIRYGNIAQNAR